MAGIGFKASIFRSPSKDLDREHEKCSDILPPKFQLTDTASGSSLIEYDDPKQEKHDKNRSPNQTWTVDDLQLLMASQWIEHALLPGERIVKKQQFMTKEQMDDPAFLHPALRIPDCPEDWSFDAETNEKLNATWLAAKNDEKFLTKPTFEIQGAPVFNGKIISSPPGDFLRYILENPYHTLTLERLQRVINARNNKPELKKHKELMEEIERGQREAEDDAYIELAPKIPITTGVFQLDLPPCPKFNRSWQ